MCVCGGKGGGGGRVLTTLHLQLKIKLSYEGRELRLFMKDSKDVLGEPLGAFDKLFKML